MSTTDIGQEDPGIRVGEWLELINLAIQRQFFAAAAWLFRLAFADRPNLCEPSQGRRLAAA